MGMGLRDPKDRVFDGKKKARLQAYNKALMVFMMLDWRVYCDVVNGGLGD
jgi:hypothetical protein